MATPMEAHYEVNEINEISRPGAHNLSTDDVPRGQHNRATLIRLLNNVANGHGITMAELQRTAGDDWPLVESDPDVARAFADALQTRLMREKGQVPSNYTSSTVCLQCGEVPMFQGCAPSVLACPWCFNRVAGLPIPRPDPVTCGNCLHFRQTDHAHLGHCARGQPEAPAGLWDTDRRACARWRPQEQTRGGPHGQ